MFRRMLWDLNPKSWISRRRLKRFRNEVKGKKALILCNGPSLKDFHFNIPDDVFVIGMNKINLLWEESPFPLHAIAVVNGYVIEQNRDFYNRTDIPLFCGYNHRKWIEGFYSRSNVSLLHNTGAFKVSSDCSWSIVEGATVTVVALQLALDFGFEKVGIIGCDHSFSAKGPGHKLEVKEGEDKDHFHPDYFAHGMKWQLPDLPTSEFFYYLALREFNRLNREIYNCTPGSKLDVFPRKDIDQFLNC